MVTELPNNNISSGDTPLQECKDWEIIEDFKNLPVGTLIGWNSSPDHSDAYIVFLNHRDDVDYKTKGKYDKIIESAECGEILNQIETLQVVPIEYLTRQTIIDFRSMLGTALVRVLCNDQKNGTVMVTKAKEFVTARNQEVARKWFLIAAMRATVISLSVALICWLFRDALIFIMGVDFPQLVVAGAAGATGAMFSVLTRTAKIPLDPAAGRKLHCLEGSARIIAGITAGIVVYLATTTGVITTKLLDTGLAGQALLCIAAGASERLVGTIIKRVDLASDDAGNGNK